MSAIPATPERPKPHILVLGKVDANIRTYLAGLGSGVMFRDRSDEVRQLDFDFIVAQHTEEGALLITGNATVLHFWNGTFVDKVESLAQLGAEPTFDEYGEPDGEHYTYRVDRAIGNRAVDLVSADGPYENVDFRSIITSTVKKPVVPGGPYSVVKANAFDPSAPDPRVHPLFEERDGDAIAAIIEFGYGVAPFWSFPPETKNALTWVKFFIQVQKQLHPEAFPSSQVGLTDEWRVAAELEAQRRLEEHHAETAQLVAEREQQAALLQHDLDAATEEADEGDRLLLFAHDDPLVERVAETLQLFGFEVRNMDEVAEKHQTAKKEDLRVIWPNQDGDDWIAVVEVKGYTKAAKQGDLIKIYNAVKKFIRQEKRVPSATWYVVNHYRFDAPQGREPLLKNAAEDVAAFAETDGLVLDTRQLFRLKQLVDTDQLAPDAAARMLMEARGVLELTKTT